MAWNNISESQAKQHQLYGVKGWLLTIVVLSSLSVVFGIAMSMGMMGPAFDSEMELTYGINTDTVRTVMLIQALIWVPFIALAFMKHKMMPKVAIASLWASFLMTVYIQMSWAAAMQTSELVISAVTSALLTWYLMASKRVNVTFNHRIHSGSGQVAQATSY